MTTTPPVTSIADELLAELEQLAQCCKQWPNQQAWPGAYDGQWFVGTIADGERYEVLEVETLNYDQEQDAEPIARYYATANPATILALLQHVRELRVKADRYDWLVKEHNDGYGGIWVSAWDSEQVAWVSLDASWRPEYDGQLDLDAAIDAARSSTT